MIETVRELAHELSRADATVDALLGRLGGEGEELGDSVIVHAPAVAGVARAGIVRQAGGSEPAHVTLELAQPQPLRALEAAFGTPRPIHPDHPGEPVRLLYDLELPGRPFTVALLAADDGGSTLRLTLRRDIRLI